MKSLSKRKVIILSSFLFLLIVGYGIYRLFPSGSSQGSVSLPDTKTIVQGYNPQNSRSMQYLDMLVMKGSAAISEMKPYVNDGNPQYRWEAVYVIGRVGNHDTAAVLLPLLKDSNETVRIAAAGTLANKGYKEALPVLIAGLNSSAPLDYLFPQRLIADFSKEVLTVYTKQSFSTQAEWQAWWQTNGTNLIWETSSKTYHS